MTQREIEELERKLRKRGFRRAEVIALQCDGCGERSKTLWHITGTTGGREIEWCWNSDCGKVRSFRTFAGAEQRAEDVDFDLRAFVE